METNSEYARFRCIFPVGLLVLILTVLMGPYLFTHAFDGLIRIYTVYALFRITFMAYGSMLSLYRSLKVPVRRPEEYQVDVTYAWVIPSYNE